MDVYNLITSQSLHWTRASLVALIINHSGVYNRRRLEYIIYGLWNSPLHDISFRLSSQFPMPFVVIPQYGIFRNPQDAINPGARLLDPRLLNTYANEDAADMSAQTQADDAARGVAVDFAIAFPCHMALRQGTGPIDRLFNMITTVLWRYRAFQLLYLLIPVLVELKRGPTRHPADALEFVTDLHNLISEAKTQGRYQAHCLFSNVRYGHQKTVIHIAGSAEFWCWREYKREEFAREQAMFSFQDYTAFMEWAQAADDTVNAGTTPDELDDAIEDELVEPGQALETLEARMAAIAARDQRAVRRSANRDIRLQASQQLPNYDPDELIFPDETLDAAAYFINIDASHYLVSHPFTQAMDNLVERTDGYSGIMRLGTPVSNKHLEMIMQKVASETSAVLQDFK
ncbi:hypothetical protein K523DRAFT_411721 [Schizophyllum commune Tattone D]|nr:hypothetical protein K523DRAFT_411721 [Schizophyllum commune Tattone D]